MGTQRVELRTGADFGLAIREARHERQLTQEAMAEANGITRSYLSQLERGRTTSALDLYFRILRRAGARIIVTFDEEADSGAP
jgi:transcriptional regulator with XRE-family HTH domain